MDNRRHLDLEGAVNVRDLGGYETLDGRRTRWHTLLRSATMHRLTPGSQAALVDYGVRSVIDLRTSPEIEAQPNVFAGSSRVAYLRQNMIGDEPGPAADLTDAGAVSDDILASYGGILDRRKPQVRQTLATLAEPGRLPAVFHCAGGKDRTGIVAALVLALAGVPPETIAEDYALTARYLLDRYFAEQAPPGVSPDNYTMLDYQRQFCPPEGMLKVLGYLGDRYGGVEGYVRAIGLSDIEIGRLRSAVVE